MPKKPKQPTFDLPTLNDVAFDPSGLSDDTDDVFDAGQPDTPPAFEPRLDTGGPQAPPRTDPPSLRDAAGTAKDNVKRVVGDTANALALDHVQEARDVRFKRHRKTGRGLPADPKPAPESDGVDRHPKRGTYVSDDATDAGVDRRTSDGRFVSERQQRRRNRLFESGGDR